MDTLYKTIENLCAREQITVTEMCRRSKVPRSALSDYKYGRIKQIGVDKLQRIADYFGVSLDYLFGNEAASYEQDSAEQPKLISDQELLLLCRKVESAPKEKREQIKKILSQSVDNYLRLMGIDPEK